MERCNYQMGFYNIKVRRIMADVYIINKKD